MKKIAVFMLFIFLALSAPAIAGEVKTMDKDELKSMLGSPELVVLDVRTGKDWSSSEFKIQGAVRLEGGDIDSSSDQFSKDSTIVLYCA